MSNKSRMPSTAKAGTQAGQGFRQFLEQAAAKAKENQSTDNNGEGVEADEDLNDIPKPKSQSVEQDFIQWDWECHGGTFITAKLYTKNVGGSAQWDHEVGDYIVEMMFASQIGQGKSVNVRIISREEAHDVGSALLAAYKWHDVWREYAGDFLWSSLTEDR